MWTKNNPFTRIKLFPHINHAEDWVAAPPAAPGDTGAPASLALPQSLSERESHSPVPASPASLSPSHMPSQSPPEPSERFFLVLQHREVAKWSFRQVLSQCWSWVCSCVSLCVKCVCVCVKSVCVCLCVCVCSGHSYVSHCGLTQSQVGLAVLDMREANRRQKGFRRWAHLRFWNQTLI